MKEAADKRKHNPNLFREKFKEEALYGELAELRGFLNP